MLRIFRSVAFIAVLLFATVTFAQRTGGRFGGSRSFSSGSSSSSSSWGSSSRSSSSGSTRSSWSSSSWSSPRSSSSSSSYNYSTSSSDSSDRSDSSYSNPLAQTDPDTIIVFVLVILGLIVLFVVYSFFQTSGSFWGPSYKNDDEFAGFMAPVNSCEVRVLNIAFDWNSRAQIQGNLDTLAQTQPMDTPQGMFNAAIGALTLMERNLHNARYFKAQRYPLTPDQAEMKFSQLATDYRSRYTVETVSNARKIIAPESYAKEEEGKGLVVVTIILGNTSLLRDFPTRTDTESIREAFSLSRPLSPNKLVALEVIWSPSEENDRMSSAELETLYPELKKINGDSPGVGKVQCAYCNTVFAAEVVKCPSCGAPAE